MKGYTLQIPVSLYEDLPPLFSPEEMQKMRDAIAKEFDRMVLFGKKKYKVGDRVEQWREEDLRAGSVLIGERGVPRVRDIASSVTVFTDGGSRESGGYTILYLPPEEPDPTEEMAKLLWNQRNEALELFSEYDGQDWDEVSDLHRRIYLDMAEWVNAQIEKAKESVRGKDVEW